MKLGGKQIFKKCCFLGWYLKNNFPQHQCFFLRDRGSCRMQRTKGTNWYSTDNRCDSLNVLQPFRHFVPSLPLPPSVRVCLCRSEWTVLWREECCTRQWPWWRIAAPSSGTWPSPWTGTLSMSCLTIRWGSALFLLLLSGETPSGRVMQRVAGSLWVQVPVTGSVCHGDVSLNELLHM